MTDHAKKGAYGGAFTDDLRAPAVSINLPGPTGVPGRDPTTGWLLFDKDATEVIFIGYQLPHGWMEGSAISFHVHWHKSTSAAGTVAWRMKYRYSNIGTVWSAWSSGETVTTPRVSDTNVAEVQALTAFTPITVPNGKISMGLTIELARVGSADSYGADAVLTDADCHISVNAPGSAQEWVKYAASRQFSG